MARIKSSITLIIVAVLTISISLVLWIFATLYNQYELRTSQQKLENKLQVYTAQLSKSLIKPLWNFDNEVIADLIESQMDDPEVFAISVRSAGENQMRFIRSRDDQWRVWPDSTKAVTHEPILTLSLPIVNNHQVIGQITLSMTQRFIRSENKAKNNLFFLGVAILELTLIAGVFIMLWKVVIQPIKKIEKYAVSVNAREQPETPSSFPHYLGELSVLNTAITQMVTILHQRYKELQLTEQKFRNLFEKTPISIWLEDVSEIFDHFTNLRKEGITNLEAYLKEKPDTLFLMLSKLKIIEINNASCRLFGSPGSDYLAENLVQLFTQSAWKVLEEGVVSLWYGHTVFERETMLKTLQQEIKYTIFKWNLIKNADHSHYLLISITDITEQKQTEFQLTENEKELKLKNEEYLTVNEELSESNQRILLINEELRKAKEKAEESDNLKTAFLCNMSHEIRTPLNAIVGFTDLLMELTSGNHDPKALEYMSIIQSSSNQLLSIVTDILTISRIQTGQEVINMKPVPIHTVLENQLNIFLPRMSEKMLSLVLMKGSAKTDFTILTDETKLIQIISNLLHNALKFTHEGYIEFGYKINQDKISFYVKDTGIGISDSSQKLIFERFAQASKEISVYYGGTGLGLSISKAFAEMLGGTLQVTSRINKGSTFTLTLPLIEYQSDEEVTIPHPYQVPARKTTILIAEDENYNYQLLEAILSAQKYNLLRACNGKEAVEACKSNSDIDLVLMDIKMPVLDGVLALEQIRKFRRKMPVIAQTAYALEHERQELMKRGFNDYLSKPIKKAELMDKILKFTE